ncbi:MAG TPA: MBL fold metallo-hydrolase [Planctomycetota bacterium]|jgi:glyoxylase-like metal-dependent hydrolase (beta-lactamase superfamily II)
MRQNFRQIEPNLFMWTDTCNVYVLRDGDAALLIDLGDGSVLDHLKEIGVSKVEWVLFTHHHREQCWGASRLGRLPLVGSPSIPVEAVAAPEAERALFEKPTSFRKMRPSLGDQYTVHGASYVRPPSMPIKIDRTFKTMDEFTWRGHEFICVDTRGNSPGSMTYLLRKKVAPASVPAGNGGSQKAGRDAGATRFLAFSGDVMCDGAKMHNWFDTEWDYGFAAGIYALHNSASLVERYNPSWLLPSHGKPISNPAGQLRDYMKKLRKLATLLVRGYEVTGMGGGTQDLASTPTVVPHLWQVTPHLYKLKGPEVWANFGILLADNGHALVVDAGCLSDAALDQTLTQMQERLGLKAIDAVIITHMHGDHIGQAPHLREKWGAKIWTLDTIAEKFEFPERFDYCAMIESYGPNLSSVKIDRTFHDGEKFAWEGYDLQIDWMPGQTEFGLCVQGMIDGKRIAFTGDNLFGNPNDEHVDGHEALCSRNSAILEEGYIYAAEYLTRLKPDIIVGGHSYVMDKPAGMIKRYREWAYKMRDAFRELSTFSDYRYMFDAYWVSAYPYRVTVERGKAAEFTLTVRNFNKKPQEFSVVIAAPGLSFTPTVIDGTVQPESRLKIPVQVQVAGDAPPTLSGVQIVSFDVTIDGQRCAGWFDMIVNAVQPK